MIGIPRAPSLGLPGSCPSPGGALTAAVDPLGDWSWQTLGARATGRTLLVLYGTIILSFMSGAIWGFATRAEGRHAAVLYALSTAPALWALFLGFSTVMLALGFLALLLLDGTRSGPGSRRPGGCGCGSCSPRWSSPASSSGCPDGPR
jgi:hypothetical protein